MIGNYLQSGGSTLLGGTGGKLTVTQQVILSGGTLTLDNGIITAGAGMFIEGEGILAGKGAINGDVTNDGKIKVGDVSDFMRIGILAITGDYEQTGILEVDLAGTGYPGMNYDQLQVTGNASLGGTLNVGLLNGFMPTINNAFSLVMFGSGGGVFGIRNLPALPTGQWAWGASETAFTIWVIP